MAAESALCRANTHYESVVVYTIDEAVDIQRMALIGENSAISVFPIARVALLR